MKLFTKRSLDELKEKVNIGKILREQFDFTYNVIGGLFPTPAFTYGKCPFCEEEESFFNLEGTNVCTCFNCSAHGDAIDLLMGLKKWSFVETVEYLAKRFDVELEEETKETPFTKEQRRTRKESFKEAIKLMEEVDPGSVSKELIERMEKMSDE